MHPSVSVSIKKEIDPAKIIYLDLANTDEKKTFSELTKEGKMWSDPKGRAFVISDNTRHPYNMSNPPVRKIYIDEIHHISMTRYYKEMHMTPPGQREPIRDVYWVYHRGPTVHDIISKETFDELIHSGEIKEAFYTHFDVVAGRPYWRGNRNTEPTQEEIAKIDDQEDKINQDMGWKKVTSVVKTPPISSETLEESPLVVETPLALIVMEEVLETEASKLAE